MKNDLISRQAALNQITAIETSIIPYARAREYVDELKSYVIKIIEDLPSAEPERKEGQWSNYKDEHCCSVCKCVVISDCWDDEIRYDYCPYCGSYNGDDNEK